MWACEAQIPRGAHRIQEGANAPPPPPKLNPANKEYRTAGNFRCKKFSLEAKKTALE